MTFMTEDQLQAECFQLTWNFFPELRRLFWHVPNGKGRSIIEAVQLKAMGVVRGVSDIHFFYNSRLHIIELKTETGRLSEDQKKYEKAMSAQGATFHICRTIETWKQIVWDHVLGRWDDPGGCKIWPDGKTWRQWRDYKGGAIR